MICRLPPAVHQALVADTARAMASQTPAVEAAMAEAISDDNQLRLQLVPTTAFDLFVPDAPAAQEAIQ